MAETTKTEGKKAEEPKAPEKENKTPEIQGQPVVQEKPIKPIEKKICSTCKKDSTNEEGTVEFECPACHGTHIVRCRHCKSIAAPYKCSKCGFIGPN